MGQPTPTQSPEFWRQFGAAGPELEAAMHRTGQLSALIVAAIDPHARSASTGRVTPVPNGGARLAEYAKNQGANPARFEGFEAAARRILAGGTTAAQSVDATSRWLEDTADALFAAVESAEAKIGAARTPAFDAALAELRAQALLARFHARRTIAAVHYNLFLRGLRLAELLAATLTEKEAVAVWRELVAVTAGQPELASGLTVPMPLRTTNVRAELKELERSLKELEEQCCPPDEAIMKEKVWTPAPRG
jgi:hypothetical protein